MKVIISSTELRRIFTHLLHTHQKFSCLVAWAGIGRTPFTNLYNNQHKINQAIIGTHFYQTHPDFISRFQDNKCVRFVKQPSGVFHPKVFLFHSNNFAEYDMLIGSANLTDSAFFKNTEVTIWGQHKDTSAAETLATIQDLLKTWWPQSSHYSTSELARYRTIWSLQQDKLESLSGNYGKEQERTPFYNIPVAIMNWREYITQIHNQDVHGVQNRLAVLATCRTLFNKTNHFNELLDDERKFIAGLPNKYVDKTKINSMLFGSMKGAGDFANRIRINDPHISAALDHIPLSGQITRSHYDRYINEFSKTLNGKYLATATRLLAMKRPDVFYCLTSANQKRFCTAFGLTYSHMDYKLYWKGVINRLTDCNWWAETAPQNDEERLINDGRAAFLDAIYYEGDRL